MSTKKKETTAPKILKQVQEHYMDYPYPLRNPEDERTRLLQIFGDSLGELNHWLFKGKENFKNNFRALVAGAGTGDSVIYLAEQLKNTNAEVVYLDFSQASMDIAKKRAEIRGLTNITWVLDTILNIPNLKLGSFDYINCVGVLHHLESPDEGLKILSDSLTNKGGVGIMVYALYGRTGVYHIQQLMQMINKGVTSRAEEVKNGWSIVKSLPVSNWYVRGKELISDLETMGDIGIYDLFLHKQDRAYTIPELYEFIEKANLNFVDFSDSGSRLLLRLENFITDPEMLAKLKAKDVREQQAICEIMAGKVIKHSFYASRQKNIKAEFEDLNNVPYFFGITGMPKQIYDYLEANPNIVQGHTISFPLTTVVSGEVTVTLPVYNFSKLFFKYLVPETWSLREILDRINSEHSHKIDEKEFTQVIKNTLTVLESLGILLLKDKSCL